MTTLKELIKVNSWPSISSVLTEIYPDEENNLEGYETVFNGLKMISPEDNGMLIVLKNIEEDGEEYVDVSGKHKFPTTEEDHFSQAIEFLPWREWLAMEISLETLSNFSELEIIVHCLYEMTFMGFDEEDIQEELNIINRSVDEYEGMSKEEKTENTRTWDELLKKWKEDDLNSEEE